MLPSITIATACSPPVKVVIEGVLCICRASALLTLFTNTTTSASSSVAWSLPVTLYRERGIDLAAFLEQLLYTSLVHASLHMDAEQSASINPLLETCAEFAQFAMKW